MRAIRPGLAVFCLCLLSVAAQAADRFAFVVGVDAYPNLGAAAQLERPVADAGAVAAALTQVGFRVTLLSGTVTQEGMLRRFGSFAEAVRPGDTAVVYFAGHGIALQGTNFLLPSDIPAIEPGQEMLARSRALAETDLSAALRERGARVVVMVIDACRDNPFPKTGTRSVGQSRGLARTEPAEGVFSLYAASAGQQALDRLPGTDPSPNSVFTRVFVAQLRRPDLNLIDLGESVRDEVAKLAETVPHRQVPAYYNEVRGARFVSLASPDELPRPGATPTAVAPVPTAPPPQAAAPPPAPEPRIAALPERVPPQPIPQAAPQAAPRVPATASFSYPIGLDPSGDNWVALRSLPSGSAGTRLAKLGPNALFTVVGRQGAWVAVRLPSGQGGWVHGDYVGCCRRAPAAP
ncbi:caspase family protein [Methylobacterium dankookense]|uniref:Caspase family p20 domain-containing protein n=1 Tax=Methylobacterium dankookense TaxID=560405 RepID=A0A564G1R6_9HYPH|nr:caspase family protein [Methylobacterium dankookense]GJD54674.1 hypothetical protein IFDJLNFL_0550 [Methylobacterium dankookense]VUF14433.1 hypothetical protein MTDSW087_04157 [Methylobacterium dankookense]